jgi:hypothetical protein
MGESRVRGAAEVMGVLYDAILGCQPDKHGTYELCGPSINGNPEGLEKNVFLLHGAPVAPIDFKVPTVNLGGYTEDHIRFLKVKRVLEEATAIEGIVFHHPDGRMCKIRRNDFGFPWGKKR